VPEGKVAFLDEVHGPQEVDVEKETGDFVVMRADGIAAYQLAVVVDDAAMAVTEVVRGDDLLSSTARQLLLYQALKKTAPRFAHVPLLVGEDGARLAKRHGALSLGELRKAGCDPRRVLGLLAATAGLTPKGARVTPSDLLNGYEEARIMKTPAVLRGSDVSALLS
jgi:glutamyl-tRNA synthetase